MAQFPVPCECRNHCQFVTQPQHQGAGNAAKIKPEELLAEVERKVAGSIPRGDVAFSVFDLTIMFLLNTFAYSELVVCSSHCNRGSFT